LFQNEQIINAFKIVIPEKIIISSIRMIFYLLFCSRNPGAGKTDCSGVPAMTEHSRGEPGTKIMLINIFMLKIQEKIMKNFFSE